MDHGEEALTKVVSPPPLWSHQFTVNGSRLQRKCGQS